MNAYTTIEESKKLLDLGLSPESANMYYFLDPTPLGNIYIPSLMFIEKHLKSRMPEYDKGDIPCWSLAALLDIIDNNNILYILNNDHGNESEYNIGVVINQEGKRKIFDFDKIIDCITWLLENNYIKNDTDN